VRHHQERLYMVETASLPQSLFPDLHLKEVRSHRAVALAQLYGLLLGKAYERVTPATADPIVAARLGIAPGTTVTVLDRVVVTLDGRPAEWRLAHCHLVDEYYAADMV
jgi:GntR family transcriptional regulator